jgi:hypothetical protein
MSSRITVPRDLSSGLAGGYVIERELGRGGSAVVSLARDLRHERLVAITVLRQERAGDRRYVTVRQSESDIWVMDLKR